MQPIIHFRLRGLYQYWLAIKKNRHLPSKDDLNLHRISSHLPSVYLIEWNPVSAVFIWRLTGTRLCKLWGRELSKTPVLDLWEPEQYEKINNTLHGVRTAFHPFCIRLHGVCGEPYKLGLEMLALPLLDAVNTRVLIFGALVPFKTPFWLDEYPLQRLHAWEIIAPDGRYNHQCLPTIPFPSALNYTNRNVDKLF